MRRRRIGFAVSLALEYSGFIFGQANSVQRGATFTTNENGGIVDAPNQQSSGQRGQRGGPAAPAGPAPRMPNGRVMLAAPLGESGLWSGGITNLAKPIGSAVKVPYQPWAQDRRQNALEPHTCCKPSGGPRQFLTPYGVEFVELPDLQRIFTMDVGGPHAFRTIYMDGRPRPKNFNNTKYEVTVDDPGSYTAPWTGQFNLRNTPGDELFQYICQDNNFAPSSCWACTSPSIAVPSFSRETNTRGDRS